MAEASGSGGPELRSSQDVINRFQSMRQEISQLSSKINELEGDVQEHDLVIKSLEPMDASRKCFRLIGGVLVERTVAEVMPAVSSNKQKLEEAITKLEEQRETKNSELSAFQTKYKIRVKSQNEESEPESSEDSSRANKGGVLA
mmetsp:Transcript_22648/g.62867  ORF Transcript_22648/g.62867 Transcript_22648/m.62867 type:complete len:144 (+) Transcript_22648:215-646(+)|eukprot:CAMPEP_0117688508 /NCGR_PEP_ID=MMETSP0804-20121206/23881_1 /TAXON_ID=1074897 /ORGANISM="Tetraselmis astigmatica, Strain CCMP880" /LENGTH=143 /DNA_ID=CAMNT_0005500993 /DNA_START=163 /DNA_END=594 /DNA_ORIENTATION=-